MVRKTVLPNGIRIVSEEIPYVQSVSLGFWVGTGSRHEELAEQGISHFIEHLLFKGTTTRSAKMIAEEVDAIGGQINAFTTKEYTCYYMKALAHHLPFLVELLSDMILHPAYRLDDIVKEREVVLEEYAASEDSPEEWIFEVHCEQVWYNHPLGRSILGTKQSIQGFEENKVRSFLRNHYCADNLVIAAAGCVKHEEFVLLVEKYLSEMAGHRVKKQFKSPDFVSQFKIEEKDTEQVHLCLSTPGVSCQDPALYAAHLLNTLLGGGMSSRLFQTIREDKGLAYSVYSYQSPYSDTGLFTIYAATRSNQLEQVLRLIGKSLRSYRSEEVSDAELQRGKEQLKGALLLGLESTGSRMARLGKQEMLFNKFWPVEELVSVIEAIKASELKQLSEKYFRDDQISLTLMGPVQSKTFENFSFKDVIL